jgi:DNA-binding MarR family transcriptional regulator
MPPKASKLSKTEYESLAAFRYSLRQFLRFSEDAAHAAGITPQHHQALLAIKGFPGRDTVTVGELAERLQILHHSAVGLVDRLVADQLVIRKQAKEDRRQVLLSLTAKGEAILEKLSAAHKDQLARMGPKLNEVLQRLAGDPAPAEVKRHD